MIPENTVNGTHTGKVLLKFDVGKTDKIVNCPTKGCDEIIRVSNGDHYKTMQDRKCVNRHPFLIWFSPENQTYLVTTE